MCALSQSYEQGLIPLILQSLQNKYYFHLVQYTQEKQIIHLDDKWWNNFAKQLY